MTVSTGAGLTVTNFTGPTTIGGDIKADGCDIVVLDSHSSIGFIVVGGDLNIQNCNILTYAVQGDAAPRVLIGGDVKCIGNNSCLFSRDVIGGSLNCSRNLFGCFLADIEIGGTATLNDNSGAGISVGANVIGGDLKCNGNAAATSLVANLVAGTKSGQCSAF